MPGFKYHTNNMQSLRDLHPKTGVLASVFPELTFENRYPIIINYMESLMEQGFNLFGEQELDDISSIMMQEFFTSKGYHSVIDNYCDDKFSTKFLFAFNPEEYEFVNPTQPSQRIAFTETGLFLTDQQRDELKLKKLNELTEEEKASLPKRKLEAISKEYIFKHNLGVEYEKSAQIIELRNKQNGEIFKIYNTHPGLPNEHRLMCMDILSHEIKRDIAEHPEINIVLAGDMNQFDMTVPNSTVYLEQTNKISEMGLDYVTMELVNSESSSTFFSDPYDIMRYITKEQKDRIFALKDTIRDKSGDDCMTAITELRELYQSLNQELIERNILRLSTVLDGIALYGPAFKNHQVSVQSDTYLNNSFFKTNVPGLSKTHLNEIIRTSDKPLPSDHFGVGVMVEDEEQTLHNSV